MLGLVIKTYFAFSVIKFSKSCLPRKISISNFCNERLLIAVFVVVVNARKDDQSRKFFVQKNEVRKENICKT